MRCHSRAIARTGGLVLGHRGCLTGQIKSPDQLGDDDFRLTTPRFERENFEANLRLVTAVETIANDCGCTPGQLALAWLLAQGEQIVPIPGTKRRKYLEDNAGAAAVVLSREVLERIDAALPRGAAAGERYGELGMRLADA